MAKTFKQVNKSKRIREPLYTRSRAKYRAVRSSSQENVETNVIKIDISRLSNELSAVDISILEDLTILVGDKSDITTSVLLDDGLSYQIDGVDFTFSQDGLSSTVFTDIEIDTIDKLSGKISRLYNKINILEAGN